MAYSRKKIHKDIGLFLKRYRRKGKHINGFDPNDRNYDRKLESIIKKMNPEELSEIMHGDNNNN